MLSNSLVIKPSPVRYPCLVNSTLFHERNNELNREESIKIVCIDVIENIDRDVVGLFHHMIFNYNNICS